MSSGSGAAPKAQQDKLSTVLESKGVKFHIKTGGAKYACQIHPNRPSFERVKARASSATSIASASSTASH